MTCHCGHPKKNHSMENGEHLGMCDFRTHFSDRPNEVCNCQHYVEASKVQCSYCGKRGSIESIRKKAVSSIITNSIYVIRLCRGCYNKPNGVVEYGGKTKVSVDEVAWICECGKYCDDQEACKKHCDESGHNNGSLWLKPKQQLVKKN